MFDTENGTKEKAKALIVPWPKILFRNEWYKYIQSKVEDYS